MKNSAAVLCGMVGVTVLVLLGCQSGSSKKDAERPATQAGEPAAAESAPTTASAEKPKDNLPSFEVIDLKVGTGKAAEYGNKVVVNYTGWLKDGAQFDSSEGRGPFEFTLGKGQVIQGWEMGVRGMKPGGKRKLIIPPHLGYGYQGAGDKIPPNATLVFEVELLEIR